MKKFIFLLILFGALPAAAQEYTMQWRRTLMDESRTGTAPASAENIKETLGYFDGAVYVAPNGKRFQNGTATAAVAKIMLDAQPAMAHVKEVIGYAPEGMVRTKPECALSDLFADQLRATVEKLSGKQVDFALANFGGIRTDLPQGDILLDDILSMFPFKNYTCYLRLRGKDLRALLEQLAATRGFQPVSGVRCKVKDGKLVEVTVGGKPLQADKIYGVATISFLLNGGDNIFVAKNALELQQYPVLMSDFMVDYVKAQTAAGKPVVYQADGRVIVEE